MQKKIRIGLAILFASISAYIFYALSPSYNIKNYEAYYVNDTLSPSVGAVKVTFFGVSSLLFDDGETQILIDGFFSRPSLWQLVTSKIKSDTALIHNLLADYKMDKVKGIFVSHSHYDHALDVAYTAQKTRAILYGSFSTLNIGRGAGLPESQMKEFKDKEKIQLGQFSIQILASKHSQPNLLKDDGVAIAEKIIQPANFKDYHEGGSFDFLIQHKGHSMYIKPSANFVDGMLDSVKADVLFMAIGTIGNKETIWKNTFYEQTAEKLNPKILIPLHWDNFMQPLSPNLEMLPHFAANGKKDFDFILEKTKANHIDFKILQGGKSILLFNEN